MVLLVDNQMRVQKYTLFRNLSSVCTNIRYYVHYFICDKEVGCYYNQQDNNIIRCYII